MISFSKNMTKGRREIKSQRGRNQLGAPCLREKGDKKEIKSQGKKPAWCSRVFRV